VLVAAGRGERFGGDCACLSDPRRRLRDERRNGSGLHVDSGTDLVEALGSPPQQGVERSGESLFGLSHACRRIGTRGFDLCKPIGEAQGGFGDDLIGASHALGELAHLLSECGGLFRRIAANQLQLIRNGTSLLFRLGQVFEEDADIDPRRAGSTIERFAVAEQLLGAAVELARNPAKLSGGLVAELH